MNWEFVSDLRGRKRVWAAIGLIPILLIAWLCFLPSLAANPFAKTPPAFRLFRGVLTIEDESATLFSSYGAAPWHADRARITSIYIGDGVETIGDLAFEDCRNVRSVRLSPALKHIGLGAFKNCENLESVEIPASVREIEDFAFSGCRRLREIRADKNNPVFQSVDGVLLRDAGRVLARYPPGKEDALYRLPQTVTRIGPAAFADSVRLRGISILNQLESIDAYAFVGCTSLSDVTLPKSIQFLGEGAFSYCRKLSDLALPESLKRIGKNVFAGCDGLASVTLPVQATDVDVSAFWNMASLRSMQAADENQAFASLDGVLFRRDGRTLLLFPPRHESTSYKIPSEVETIGFRAFADCPDLEAITLPMNVKRVEGEAFVSCAALKTLNFTGAAPPTFTSADTFAGAVVTSVVVPLGQEDAYRAALRNQGIPDVERKIVAQ